MDASAFNGEARRNCGNGCTRSTDYSDNSDRDRRTFRRRARVLTQSDKIAARRGNRHNCEGSRMRITVLTLSLTMALVGGLASARADDIDDEPDDESSELELAQYNRSWNPGGAPTADGFDVAPGGFDDG